MDKKKLTKHLFENHPELLEPEAIEVLCFLIVANLIQRGVKSPLPAQKELQRMWKKSIEALSTRYMQPKGDA